MRLTLSASSYGIWRRYLRFLDTPLKRNPLFNNSVLTLLESLTDATLSSCPAYTTLHSWVTPEEWRSLLRKGKLDVFNTEMENYFKLDHAEVIPQNELSNNGYYLPVHGVFKDGSTTTKVRPVFDTLA